MGLWGHQSLRAAAVELDQLYVVMAEQELCVGRADANAASCSGTGLLIKV